MPLVREAVAQLDRELTLARQQRCAFVKFIHGYGSSGAGGDIRIAIQKRLRGCGTREPFRACIFGEDWSASDAADLDSAEIAASFEGRLRFRQARTSGSPLSCSERVNSCYRRGARVSGFSRTISTFVPSGR